MDREDSSSHADEHIIGSATSSDEIVAALAKRGCEDLTTKVDLAACGDFPCADGGFCDVYQGKLYNGTKIAIKSLRVYDGPNADTDRKKLLKHAARELYHWSKLQHSNVLPLLGFMRFRDRISMVSEWMENGTLRSFLKCTPEASRARLCMDVCEGLCYIHEQGMVHGDLKAANVMVSSHGVAMIADFGNARLTDLTLKFSNTAGHSTSLRWTAPELLAQSGSSQASKEADVYALGMTILEVVTGKIPFNGIDEVRVWGLVASERQHPPRPEADLGDDLWELLRRCWVVDPAKRPSVKGVSDQLQNLYPGCEARQSGTDPKLVCPSDTPKKIPIRTTTRPGDAARAEKARRLINLGISRMTRFQRLGDPDDLNEAIQCQTQLLLLTPDSHADKPSLLSNLATLSLDRFKLFEKLADLDTAITCLTQATSLTQDGHSEKSSLLINLGTSCLRRFEYAGELSDIDEAIIFHTEALPLIPDDHAKKLSLLMDLGTSYQHRFNRLGELLDVENAIEWQTQAVQLTPDGHPDKPSRLNNLGTSYKCRFERLGELSDLHNAIECQSQAVQLTPEGHPDRLSRLNNLATSYVRRFQQLGELSDLHNAIECQSQAVQLTPEGHPDKSSGLNNLGTSYKRRFEHLGELSDVEDAIECQTQAVQLTPEGHPDKSSRLNNLGTSYMRRFERLGELSDLHKAIECQSQAVQLTPEGHPDKSSGLNNLGTSYKRRFEHLGELSDVEDAIECQTQAVQLTPEGHPDKPILLNNLGNSYMGRFHCLGTRADLEHAHSTFQRGAQLTLTSPKFQLACARQWAKSSLLLDISPQEAYQRGMNLVPHLIWLGATINHRYAFLTNISDLVTEAASWAISVHSYDLAIEWLEEGRSIVWNQILQLRTPFDDLAAVDPVLAGRLKDIAANLERAGSWEVIAASSTDTTLALEHEARHHRRLKSEWEQRLEYARRVPGFYTFMRPRKAAELKLAATDGPVVLITTHTTRCDALIIFPECDEVAHVALNRLSQKKVDEAREQFESIVGHRGFKKAAHGPNRKPEETSNGVWTTLWSDIVKPVLDTLACSNKLPVEELPHVTWCTTGALSFLPLHAAGLYNNKDPNAFDLVVSSYTPTLSALLTSKASSPDLGSGLLAVGQETTPELSSLPNIVPELAAVKAHADSTRYKQLDGESATVNAVLDALGKHSWVHLACHASQNRANPAHTAFHLHDGPLTLQSITRKSFQNKGLAFLSACQAATGDDNIPDESVHLAAGMLMAGYPGVIATMWSIYDEDAPEVAGEVYAELLKDGKMDYKGTAKALHKAVALLREKVGHEAFERWVPFIHIGV